MSYSLVQTVAPAVEPITLAEAKLHLRVDYDDENDAINELIRAAREYVESATNRQLITATWRLKVDTFPAASTLWPAKPERRWGAIEIPKAPLQSVTSVTYVDSAGTTQTLAAASYIVDTDHEPGLVYPIYNTTWPLLRDDHNAVTIVFVAGYGLAVSVPAHIKRLMKLLIGHWYEHREAIITGTISEEIELAVESLTWLNRVPAVA